MPKRNLSQDFSDELPAAKRTCDEELNTRAILAVFSSEQHRLYHKIIAVGFHNTLKEFAEVLCKDIVSQIRFEDEGCSESEHVWKFHFREPGSVSDNGIPGDCTTSCDSSDSEELDVVKKSELISNLHLKESMDVTFDYDECNPTTIRMKVLAIGPIEDDPTTYPKLTTLEKSFDYLRICNLSPLGLENVAALENAVDVFGRSNSATGGAALMAAVPAYAVTALCRLDAVFPAFANIVMKGKHVCFTMGLCAMTISEAETTFCAISGTRSDLMFAPIHFSCIDEFMSISERAWSSDLRSEFAKYREGFVRRTVFPVNLTPAGQRKFEDMRAYFAGEEDEDEDAAFLRECYSHSVLFRFSQAEWDQEQHRLRERGFSFSEMFPRTSRQLTSGRFRWFSYNGSVLRVCVGRATGMDQRQAGARNILREWHDCKFSSFHDLICAVEASWTMPGDMNTALEDQVLAIDADCGPSHPVPAEPPVCASKEDAVELRGWTGAKACVKCLAFAAYDGGSSDGESDSQVLFVGEWSGKISRWDLGTNTMTHEVQAYKKTPCGWQKPVVGILVNPAGTLLFTWSRGNYVELWDCATLKFLRSVGFDLDSEVDGRDDPKDIYPLVVVLDDSFHGHSARAPTMYMGLYCCGNPFQRWAEESPLREEHVVGQGNIMVMETDPDSSFGTWRGHHSPVCALALVPGKYLVSIAQYKGYVENMLLWDLQSDSDMGSVLEELQWRDPSCDLWHKRQHKVKTVEGIAVHGNTIVLLCNFGAFLALIDLRTLNTLSYLHVEINEGSDSMQACLASFGGIVAPSHDSSPKVLCFDVQKLRREASQRSHRHVRDDNGKHKTSSKGVDSSGDSEEDDDHSDDSGNSDASGSEGYSDIQDAEVRGDHFLRVVRSLRARNCATQRIDFPRREVRRPPPPPGAVGKRSWECLSSGPRSTADDPEENFSCDREAGVRRTAICASHVAAGYCDGSLRVHRIPPGGLGSAGWALGGRDGGDGGVSAAAQVVPACMVSCCDCSLEELEPPFLK